MLPLALAAGACSLAPGAPRCALSVGVALRVDSGEVDDVIVAPTLVDVTRLTYDEVNRRLRDDDGAADDPVRGELRALARAALARYARRAARAGAGPRLPRIRS